MLQIVPLPVRIVPRPVHHRVFTLPVVLKLLSRQITILLDLLFLPERERGLLAVLHGLKGFEVLRPTL